MRWIVRVGLGLVVLVVLAFGILAMIPSERVAALLAAQFETMTGRKMTLAGEVSPRIWPSLGITTGPVSIANADWAKGEGPLFQAESLSVDINLGVLWGGEVRIKGVKAEAPVINLEVSKDGKQNWVFGAEEAEGEVPGAATPFTLDEGVIRGGSIRYVDLGEDRSIALDDVDLVLEVPDYAGPFTLTAQALSGGQPVVLDLTGGVFSAFSAGRVVPLTLRLEAGGTKIAFEGRGGLDPLAAEGALAADLSDLPALGRLWGADLAQPGSGMGQDRLTVAGTLTVDGSGAVFLRAAEIEADQNRMSGDFDLIPGEARPKLKGQIVAGPLSIGADRAGSGAESSAAASGWSGEAIDVSALGVLDAEIGLTAPSVTLGPLKFGATKGVVTVDRARAVIDINAAEAYGGTVTGDFVVNGRGGLSVGGRLKMAGLATQPLLTDLTGWDRLVSTGDVSIEFLGVGNSIAAIMQSLEGQGALGLGPGEIRGLDIASMLQTLNPDHVGEGEKTIFNALTGSFVIAGGVLSNSDLKLVSPYFTATGSGEIGLGKQVLDYRLRPTALAAEDGTGGVMVPLLISGPWADPRFQLDLEGIAREKMEEEAKELEKRAKKKLEAKLKEELGIEVAPDETLGEAAVDGAQDALEDGAKKLLLEILE
jgi:AsmA protein